MVKIIKGCVLVDIRRGAVDLSDFQGGVLVAIRSGAVLAVVLYYLSTFMAECWLTFAGEMYDLSDVQGGIWLTFIGMLYYLSDFMAEWLL